MHLLNTLHQYQILPLLLDERTIKRFSPGRFALPKSLVDFGE